MPLFDLRLITIVATVALGWSQSGAPTTQGAWKTGTIHDNPKDWLPYVWVQPGTFTMGCSRDAECDIDETAHQVTISKGFWIGQTEVTQAAYERVTNGRHRSEFRGDSLPVGKIDWEEAAAYCKAVGMRLPTEAEWEYAARGGSPPARYATLDAVAWYSANSEHKTHEVGQKQPNGYGLYDMLGNVFEWVSDWYGDYGSSHVTDPQGPPSGQGRVLRGGSYLYSSGYARASGRNGQAPAVNGGDIGFRCAGRADPLPPPPPPPPPPPRPGR